MITHILTPFLPKDLNYSKHKKLKKWENYTLQCLYDAIAVAHSYELGLIESTDFIENGDGSASQIYASLFVHRVLKESADGLTHRYSAPKARYWVG